jgi:hypothetical protein
MAIGVRRAAFTTLKIAVLAPMPSARVRTAMMVKPGFLYSTRAPYRTSCDRASRLLPEPSPVSSIVDFAAIPAAGAPAPGASARLISGKSSRLFVNLLNKESFSLPYSQRRTRVSGIAKRWRSQIVSDSFKISGLRLYDSVGLPLVPRLTTRGNCNSPI